MEREEFKVIAKPYQETLEAVQFRIMSMTSEDRGKLSDGYHSFNELYEHRITNFITLCRFLSYHPNKRLLEKQVWKSKYHHDGTNYEGWFIMGIGYTFGDQISYHLPISKWTDCWFANTIDIAPEWDGHSSDDVLKRLKNL
jgi:hypothetical protein